MLNSGEGRKGGIVMGDHPYRVLLIEDNPGDVQLVRLAIEQAGLAVRLHTLSDGAIACEYLLKLADQPKQVCPDVIVLDLNLPGMDGYELLKIFRDHDGCRRTPVIVATCSDRPWEMARMRRIGITDYFVKPPFVNDFCKLGDMIKKALESPSQGPSAND
jgi:two-component system response regulator